MQLSQQANSFGSWLLVAACPVYWFTSTTLKVTLAVQLSPGLTVAALPNLCARVASGH